MDCSLPASSVHGLSEARILQWVAISFFRGSSWPRDWTLVSWIAGRYPYPLSQWGRQRSSFTFSTTTGEQLPARHSCYLQTSLRSAQVKWREVAQSRPTLYDPVDCSLPGSSIHGIFQARILQWVAISFFRGASRPRDRTRVSCMAGGLFTAEPPGRSTRKSTV